MLPFLGHGDSGAERGVKLALIGQYDISFRRCAANHLTDHSLNPDAQQQRA